MERRNWTEAYWLCRKRISNLAPIQFGFLFLFVVVSLKTSRGSAQSKRMHSLIHQPHIPPDTLPFTKSHSHSTRAKINNGSQTLHCIAIGAILNHTRSIEERHLA